MVKYESIMTDDIKKDLIEFTQKLIRTRSMTCHEQDVVEIIKSKMTELGYKDITIDDMGSIYGHFGSGDPIVMFDSHTDTVDVMEGDTWNHDPYGAEIVDGIMYGRGAADMKAGLAASIYGAYVANRAGLIPEGRSVYVSASSMEEDFDGEALKRLLDNTGLRPESFVICEPSDNLQISYGHRGRALIEVRIQGVGCHASSPELGKNPIYLIRDVIKRVEDLNGNLYSKLGDHGSIALTNVLCNTVSNNSVPDDVTLILDRRVTIPETEEAISQEMDNLLAGTEATWCFSDIPGSSFKGKKFVFHSYMPAWELPTDHPFVKKAVKAYQAVKGSEPKLFKFGGNTNAISTAGLHGIPTVILGPGNLSATHSRDEYVEVSQIIDACKVYALLCSGE